MKRFIISIIVFAAFGTSTLMAQQDAMYSQYMFNTLAINPAYAGSRNVISATALHRSQWVGIPGSPKTSTLTVDAPLYNKKLGVGLQIFDDRLGDTRTNGASASLAYRVRLDQGTLSFGILGSVSQFRINLTSQRLDQINSGGDAAFSQDVNRILFNTGAGVYYNSDRFYLGLSAPELFSQSLTGTETPGATLTNKQYRHYFLAAGYVFPLGEDFDLKPSVLGKAVEGAPLQGDANLTLWIKNAVAFGLQYRTSADVSALVEIQATPQLRLGYQYDRSTTKLVNFNSGSHEIMIRYEFGSDRGKTLTPRYF